jgi:hypothetical protein
VSVILTDGRLPGPSSFWRASTRPLLLVFGIILPKRRPDSTPSWNHHRILWEHVSCGVVSAATGTCHVATHVIMCPKNISLPALPRIYLSSVISTTIGGRAFKAPRKAKWPNGHLRWCGVFNTNHVAYRWLITFIQASCCSGHHRCSITHEMGVSCATAQRDNESV